MLIHRLFKIKKQKILFFVGRGKGHTRRGDNPGGSLSLFPFGGGRIKEELTYMFSSHRKIQVGKKRKEIFDSTSAVKVSKALRLLRLLQSY